MLRKLFLYVVVPGLILGIVYTSGVSAGKKSADKSDAPAWSEFPKVQSPPIRQMQAVEVRPGVVQQVPVPISSVPVSPVSVQPAPVQSVPVTYPADCNCGGKH